MDQYLAGKLPIMPRETAFCWSHVADTARGHILAMEKGNIGENYNICGPKLTFVDALRLAEKLTGIPAPRILASSVVMRTMAGFMGLIEKIAPVPTQYSSETLRVSGGVTYLGDDSKARRDIGWSTRPIEDGLRETLLYEMKTLGITPRKPM